MPQYMKNIQSMLKNWVDNDVLHLTGSGGPISGPRSSTSAISGTGAGVAGHGSRYTDVNNGVVYVNEGTRTNPYWTPINFRQRGLIGAYTDWRNGVGVALADTAASTTLVESGVRMFGSGIEVADSGITVASALGGPEATLRTSAAASKFVCLGLDGVNPSFSPDTEGPIVIDAIVTMVTALTLRTFFLGFISGKTGGAGGTIIDATIAPVTGAATTLTLVQDDVFGLYMDVGLTAASRLFAPHNKADEAATIATTATGVDTGIDFPAAATYVRLRVEITKLGHMLCFTDKILRTSILLAATPATAVGPVMYIGSTSLAVKDMKCKQFATWGTRR